ncbi:MAG TPA: hypothetical protein VF188_18450 [Longimicrobiales bacterium]
MRWRGDDPGEGWELEGNGRERERRLRRLERERLRLRDGAGGDGRGNGSGGARKARPIRAVRWMRPTRGFGANGVLAALGSRARTAPK